MVSETGHIVEALLTSGGCNDILGLRYYTFDWFPQGPVVYADKVSY